MTQVDIEKFLDYIRPDIPNCPYELLMRELRSALNDFCASSWAWNQWTGEMNTTEGSEEITLSVPDQATSDGILQATKNKQTCSLHDLSLESDIIYLKEPLNNAATFNFHIALKPIRDVTQVPAWIYEDWAEIIGHGAKSKIFNIPGQDWFSSEVASFQYDLFRRGLAEAKAKKRVKENTRRSITVQPKEFGGGW